MNIDNILEERNVCIVSSEQLKNSEGLEESIKISFNRRLLSLSLTWDSGEENLAPLFSGACWAGTIVWQASIDLCNYISKHYAKEMKDGSSVVELGAGIGVPGMIARILGANVVLTEQAELLSLLKKNIDANFPESEFHMDMDRNNGYALSTDICRISGSKCCIQAVQLDWKTDCTIEFMEKYLNNCHPDFILCADCVYVPLYGNSWISLIAVVKSMSGPNTTALISVERRTADGVELFLDGIRNAGLSYAKVQSCISNGVPIEIYMIRLNRN